MTSFRYCAYCGKGFSILTFPNYAYKLIGKDGCVRYFCNYTCKQHYKEQNPDVVRGEKRGRKKKSN